jgi:hypothetical protein
MDELTASGAEAAVAVELAAPAALTLFRTDDPAVIVARMGELSTVLLQAVRDRGLARRYGDSDREFLHIEAWQFLGSMLGVSATVAWTRRLEDGSGWEARAEAVTMDSRVLGAGEGMCQRSEPGRRNATDHALRAMAQVRARRAALRSVLAFVAAIGGIDLADPDSPATRKQVTALHTLAGKHGWSHDESHRRAGAESFRHLTREQAADLIDAWSELPADDPAAEAELGADPAKSLEGLWDQAISTFGGKVRVLRAYAERFGAEGGLSSDQLTADDLGRLLESEGPGAPVSPPGRDPTSAKDFGSDGS